MNNEELLESIERRVFYVMFEGCFIDTHLGNKKLDAGSWSISLRADELSRLLDLAKTAGSSVPWSPALESVWGEA